ncbi:MAG TPA: hypothetical protein GXX40_05680 [Firmicutes bacterium]|nr:hypothetical protein [Bacillota bacterium]
MPKKKPVRKDVLTVVDGNVTEIASIHDVSPGEPVLRATINKRDKLRGLWMDIELIDDEDD